MAKNSKSTPWTSGDLLEEGETDEPMATTSDQEYRPKRSKKRRKPAETDSVDSPEWVDDNQPDKKFLPPQTKQKKDKEKPVKNKKGKKGEAIAIPPNNANRHPSVGSTSSDVPQGIDGLIGINSIFITQMLKEDDNGMTVAKNIDRSNNCYHIYGQAGKLGAAKPTFRHFDRSHRILAAGEVSNCCSRLCLGHNRSFTLMIFDGYGQIVVIMERKCTLMLCMFGGQCGGGVVNVKMAMTNETLGTVEKRCGVDAPTFSIFDKNGTEIMQLIGPSCAACCCTNCAMKGNAMFKIVRVGGGGAKNLNKDDEESQESTVNLSNGQLVGYVQNHFEMDSSNAKDAKDGFGIQLQTEVDIETKAVLLAAVFAIDYSFYDTGGMCIRGKFFTGLNAVIVMTLTIVLIIILCSLLA